MINTDEPDHEQEDVDEGDIDYQDHTASEHELSPEDDAPVEVTVINDTTDDEHEPEDVLEDRRRKEEAKNPYALSDRPWLRHPCSWDKDFRRRWEIMYCHLETTPVRGSWFLTEDYQQGK
ncbi:hypothetical protein LTR53_019166, partial [Teratosphaeriaceae sp. CCFEE 6253]